MGRTSRLKKVQVYQHEPWSGPEPSRDTRCGAMRALGPLHSSNLCLSHFAISKLQNSFSVVCTDPTLMRRLRFFFRRGSLITVRLYDDYIMYVLFVANKNVLDRSFHCSFFYLLTNTYIFMYVLL